MFKSNLMIRPILKRRQIWNKGLNRTIKSNVERLRSANFVDIKRSLELSNELKDQQIRLRGWINSTVKSKKNLSFFHLNDGLSNSVIQVVLSKELENNLEHNLTYGSSIICTGKLVDSKGKQQNIEFKCDQIEFAGQTELFPFHNKEKSDEWDNIRQHLHLRFKTKHFASLQRIRSKLLIYTHDYLQSKGYLNIATPLITMNDCEGGGEAFQVLAIDKKKSNQQFNQNLGQQSNQNLNQQSNQNSEQNSDQNSDQQSNQNSIQNHESTNENNENLSSSETVNRNKIKLDKDENFFGKPTYLTVSGQLHLEATALGVNRVYNLSPCFRSEDSVSRKHLSEFLMLELEETYLDSLDILMNRVESLCKNLLNYLTIECKEEIDLILSKTHKSQLDAIINNDYKRITYEDALRLINEQSDLPKLDYGANFNTTCETFLTDHFNNTPVFITHFPSYIKPFYMKTEFDKALNFDLIYPVCGEVCGGSLREDDFERMEKLFEIHNLNDLEWYKTLRKEGSIPHAGFGLGVDRFLQSILGLQNIRDVVPFPRWIHHCKC